MTDRSGPADTNFDTTMSTSAAAISAATAGAQIPGADEIPDDMPHSPPADIPLQYTLQNFNALVAANTAMQTEIATRGEMLDALAGENAHLREVIKESLEPAIASLRASNDGLEKAFNKLERERDEHRDEAEFQKRTSAALSLKLERMKGYTDRVLEVEDSYTPPKEAAQDRRQIRGPALDDIAMPVRPRRNDSLGIRAGDIEWAAAPSPLYSEQVYRTPHSY